MFFQSAWQRITTSRRTRELEAEAQRENLRRESALREECARGTHALEAQIAQAHAENCRLRAENHALLNSVLGIAGIPPVIVADPPAVAGNPAVTGRPDISAATALPAEGSAARNSSGHGSSRVVMPADEKRALAYEASAAEAAALSNASTARLKACPDARAPIRRRSWHQIYRMLEFESSRRKEHES